ncbi:hypothetical protein J5N97_024915 [Dioscorea zingiberensis]|uniref:Uncharacterized protein n=1 Tax=Dioscorea zingiberensis TaxID=325984 RepID=A0A9D5BV17_9LILI|nr:hypothetical protein J5N97_000188 [Dioscorea zingiberensis]KAJ0967998.1 hypothetical protein J5N97_024915 [Dioscorea zingiberensis]
MEIGSSSQASKKAKCRKRNNDDANKTKVSEEIPTVECMRNVSSLIDQVRIRIETCLLSYLTKEQVVMKLENEAKIDPGITLEVWARLEAENAQFFSEYYARLELIRQINTFNTLLEQQHQLMKKLQGECQFKFNQAADHQQQQQIMQMQMRIPNANQPFYRNNPMTMTLQSPSLPPMNNQVSHMRYNQYSGNQLQSMAMSSQMLEQGQSSTKRARLDIVGQSSQAAVVQPKKINEQLKQKQVIQNPSDASSLAEIPKSFSFQDLTELLNSLDSNMDW